MNKKLIVGLLAMVAIVVFSIPAAAEKKGKGPPGFGELYYDGEIVRTVVPPAAMPFEGRDNLYPFMGVAAAGQLPIAAVGPGDRFYHGGQWAVWLVTWNIDVAPYLLTSEEDVLDVEKAGDVTLTRIPEADFKCPVQP